MTGDELSAAYVRIAELAQARGAVPDDGSGIDGTWRTEVEDPDTGEPWYVAVNADLDAERTVRIPEPHGEIDVDPGHAVVFYADVFGPVAVLSPHGGRYVVDGRDPEDDLEGTFDRTTEDQLIAALEAAIETAEADRERELDVADHVLEALPDHVVETYSEKMLVLEYEERYLDVHFPELRCGSCGDEVDHRLEVDSYRDEATTECSACGAVDEAIVPDGVIDVRGDVQEIEVGLEIDVDEDAEL